MKGRFILIFFLPLLMSGQQAYSPAKDDVTKVYRQVITEYIKDSKKSKAFTFDTLFIGKHEEFPDIHLPVGIENKKIILLTHHKGDTQPQDRTSFVLINIIERKITKDSADFMLVTFHQGYQPQHNCYIYLKYDPVAKEFKLGKPIRYDYVYPKGK
jgi:hypothetical protein